MCIVTIEPFPLRNVDIEDSNLYPQLQPKPNHERANRQQHSTFRKSEPTMGDKYSFNSFECHSLARKFAISNKQPSVGTSSTCFLPLCKNMLKRSFSLYKALPYIVIQVVDSCDSCKPKCGTGHPTERDTPPSSSLLLSSLALLQCCALRQQQLKTPLSPSTPWENQE